MAFILCPSPDAPVVEGHSSILSDVVLLVLGPLSISKCSLKNKPCFLNHAGSLSSFHTVFISSPLPCLLRCLSFHFDRLRWKRYVIRRWPATHRFLILARSVGLLPCWLCVLPYHPVPLISKIYRSGVMENIGYLASSCNALAMSASPELIAGP